MPPLLDPSQPTQPTSNITVVVLSEQDSMCFVAVCTLSLVGPPPSIYVSGTIASHCETISIRSLKRTSEQTAPPVRSVGNQLKILFSFFKSM